MAWATRTKRAAGVVVLIAGLLYAGSGQVSFSPSLFEVGDEPWALVSTDVDGDGDFDLVTANHDTDDVTVLLNDGAGVFQEAGTSPEAVGSEPAGIAAADFDGDNRPDLAVSNNNGADITILLNQGGGDFAAPGTSPEPVAPGTGPRGIVAADFDGDNQVDLATANFGLGNVTVLLNAGSGDFSEPASSPVDVGSGPEGIVAGDFDGDGTVDLAVTNTIDGTVTVLIGGGSGDFTEDARSPVPVGSLPMGIVTDDFDGDGDPDLATANSFASQVAVLLTIPPPTPGPLTDCFGLTPTIVGSDEDDELTGTSGTDVIVGLGGDDVITSGGGNDRICGGDGDDSINSGGSADFIDGGPGDDVIYAGGGNDEITGGDGIDSCDGGGGSDSANSCEGLKRVP